MILPTQSNQPQEKTEQDQPLTTVVTDGVETPLLQLRDWIRLEYELFRGGKEPKKQPYDGPKDFVLQLGQDFPFRPLPTDVRRRAPRQCFYNAASLALRRPQEFLYAEGYAFTKGICTEHGWCVDRDGYAIDPTWRENEDAQYFGVPFLHGYVQRQAQERGELGCLINVWDGPERWPLCTGVQPLENALADLEAWKGTVGKEGGE